MYYVPCTMYYVLCDMYYVLCTVRISTLYAPWLIRHCHVKGCKKTCKSGFSMNKRLVLQPRVICPGNARTYDLRVTSRRNALRSVLSHRNCPWRSGSARAIATCLHHNTHAGPNYRVPLLPETHDPEWKHNCLSKHSLLTIVRAVQRAQRNTTGYYTGYVQKQILWRNLSCVKLP